MDPESRLAELGLELPPPPPPGGLYRACVVVGNLAFLSGHGPYRKDGTYITGKVGRDLDLEAGYAAARQTGLSLLTTLRGSLGSLNRVRRIIKVFGLVNCTDDFLPVPKVINGCSELFRDVFGEENGVGARSAVGSNALPLGFAVEIEAIVEIH